jgi:hypothetical protein
MIFELPKVNSVELLIAEELPVKAKHKADFLNGLPDFIFFSAIYNFNGYE